MSNVTLWARPAWEIDRWVKEGILDGFTPAAEIVQDGEDAVVRLELPGVDVEDVVYVDGVAEDDGIGTVSGTFDESEVRITA